MKGLFPGSDNSHYQLAGASNYVANNLIREEFTEEQRQKWEEEKRRAHEMHRKNDSFRGETTLLLELVKQGKSVEEAEKVLRDVIAWGERRTTELGLE